MKSAYLSPGVMIAVAAFSILVLGGLCASIHGAYKDMRERKEQERAHAALLSFADVCLKKFPAKTDTQKFDSLRHCIFVNSVFSDDKKYTSFWDDKEYMASWIWGHATGKTSEKPPMECSFRSWTLIHMLRAMGYRAQSVVTASAEDNFLDHVVVEILNPDTQRWEVHDPSYDTKYYAGNKVLGVKEMLDLGPDKFRPCDFDGRCGWDKISRENIPFSLAYRYWNTAWIRQERKMYVASSFDTGQKKKVGTEYKSFCEHRAKWCRNIVIID